MEVFVQESYSEGSIVGLDGLRVSGVDEPVDGADAEQGAVEDARGSFHREGETPGPEFRDKRRVAGPAGDQRHVLPEDHRWTSLQDEDRPRPQEDRSAGDLR